jgi:hypothetical protein
MKKKYTFAVSCAGCLLIAVPLSVSALPLQWGEVNGNFDSTITAGVLLRTKSPDAENLGITNGGTGRSVNGDDGNYGYNSGDIVSAALKATHEVQLNWRNLGLFGRFYYFYDAQYDESGGLGDARSQGSPQLGTKGRDRLVGDIQLLDLYGTANFKVFDRSLTTKVGNQVVSWGESTFIGNSINSINPIDVARIRTPGSELKEALLPTPIISLAYQLTNSLSMEAVWLAGYQKTLTDPRGSFFSTDDLVSDDSDRAITGQGRRKDQNSALTSPPATDAMAWIERQQDRDVDGEFTQFGLALHYVASALNNTEFGLFYLNYHSRTPLISAIGGGNLLIGAGAKQTTSGATIPGQSSLASAPLCSRDPAAGPTCRASYFAEYPEHISLYGLSFNTSAPFGIAVQGEYSYRPNQPLQIAGTEILLAALGSPASTLPVPAARNSEIQGYRRVEMHQLQSTQTKTFGPTFGATQYTVLGEIGANYLVLPSGVYFNGPGAGLPVNGTSAVAGSNGSAQTEGFATSFSWGYRLVNKLDYENVIGPVGMSPRLVFTHDVKGVGPNFNQDTKAITAGIGFNYLQRWQADLAYTTFMGGRTYAGTDPNPVPAGQSSSYATTANPNIDRDFLSASVSYSF